MSQFLAACRTNGLVSSKKSSIIKSPTLLSSPNYRFERISYLYLNPVSLQKCENRWIEAYFSAVFIFKKDFLTV